MITIRLLNASFTCGRYIHVADLANIYEHYKLVFTNKKFFMNKY